MNQETFCVQTNKKKTAPNTLSIQPSVYRKLCALAVNYGKLMNRGPWPFHTPYPLLQWWCFEHADNQDKVIHANDIGNSFANYPQMRMGGCDVWVLRTTFCGKISISTLGWACILNSSAFSDVWLNAYVCLLELAEKPQMKHFSFKTFPVASSVSVLSSLWMEMTKWCDQFRLTEQ